MNENINLTKILKYCPKGYKLYTPLYGEVEFKGIIYGKFLIVVTDEFRNIYFTEKGLYYDAPNAECLLFPSKEQRDWSKFTAPWLEKQGDKDKLIQELGKYKVKYTQEVLEKYITSMSNKDDERLRKTTIAFLKDFAEQGYENAVECIDWLEKQGKNSTDKIEPRFKVGDWITFYGCNPFKILKIEVDINGVLEYLLLDQNGNDFYFNRTNVDKNVRLWTIQDAKDGDVLVHSSFMFGDFIFIYNNTSILQAYCYYSNERNRFIIEDRGHHCPWNMQEVTPATKEQRDLLFQKMKEAGYEWDADKKELFYNQNQNG